MLSDESTAPATESMGATRHLRVGLLWVFPAPAVAAGGGSRPGSPRFTEIRTQAVVGRAASSDIVIDAEQVSRRHLLLRRDGPRLVAEDLQSLNGSHCNGELFSKVTLEPGSVLRIGEALAIVCQANDEQSFEFGELAPGFYGGHTLARCMPKLTRVASSDLSVIVQGPTGSGKERIAAAVHHFSGRAGRFVAINCATLPEALAESLLFGYRRGAFTGAERNEAGYFGAADGGTLFLDEVLELRLPVQARLLRVLQEREYVPLGDTRAIGVDLRVVSAAQASLEKAVRAGRFREDLYARLNGYQLVLPPLRERREDVPFLFQQFLSQRFGGRPPALRARLVEALCLHAWPHNVRELETLAKRLGVLHGHHPELNLEHLRDVLDPEQDTAAKHPASPAVPAESLPEGDTSELLAALDEQSGNVVRAAKQLGISRARAYRLISAMGIDVERYRKRSLSGQA